MCKKVKLTKKEANAFLKEVKKWRNSYRKEKRSYYCEECQAWHTTSKDFIEEFERVEEISDPTYLEQWNKLLNND